MDKKDKELLLKDLCARLPYGVIIDSKEYNEAAYRKHYLQRLITVKALSNKLTCIDIDDYPDPKIHTWEIDLCKPYLRPMSSMTEEERIEFSKLLVKRYCEEDWEGHISTSYCIEIDNVYTDDENGIKYPSAFPMDAIDWLNAHHFDFRNLIERGLAIEVAKENNPYK